jgi:hypothetical protein
MIFRQPNSGEAEEAGGDSLLSVTFRPEVPREVQIW